MIEGMTADNLSFPCKLPWLFLQICDTKTLTFSGNWYMLYGLRDYTDRPRTSVKDCTLSSGGGRLSWGARVYPSRLSHRLLDRRARQTFLWRSVIAQRRTYALPL